MLGWPEARPEIRIPFRLVIWYPVGMNKDPIVEEVRAVRKNIERQYPDAKSFYEHLEEQQKAHANRLTRRQPKKTPHAQAS